MYVCTYLYTIIRDIIMFEHAATWVHERTAGIHICHFKGRVIFSVQDTNKSSLGAEGVAGCGFVGSGAWANTGRIAPIECVGDLDSFAGRATELHRIAFTSR